MARSFRSTYLWKSRTTLQSLQFDAFFSVALQKAPHSRALFCYQAFHCNDIDFLSQQRLSWSVDSVILDSLRGGGLKERRLFREGGVFIKLNDKAINDNGLVLLPHFFVNFASQIYEFEIVFIPNHISN